MNTDEPIDWDLLAKHLFGECSEEEKARLRMWLEGDPSRRALLGELRQVWETTGRPPAAWEVDALWARVQDHVRQTSVREKARPLDRTPASRISRTSRPARSTARSLLRFAAVVAVAAATALLVAESQNAAPPEASGGGERVFATQKGERATIQLTDGTQVRLNADSRLVLASAFGSDRRDVRLEGEGYFEVASDTSRPFTIQAGQAAIRVLGTSFDVDAYPDDGGVQVVVAEGEVAFRSVQEPPEEEVVLASQQMGEVRAGGERVVHEGVDVRQHLAWIEGQLAFQDAPFSEVTRELERWYDLDVQLEGTPAVPGHLSATFADRQPLSDVLSVIATAFRLTYEQSEKAVTFAPVRPRSP